MQLATGGHMLNFGLWNENTKDPISAQRELCKAVGYLAELESAKTLLDIGSGFSEPAIYWRSLYDSLYITCVNINFHQLQTSTGNNLSLLNSTSTTLPLADSSADRIIALESAQHFKPLTRFINESRRVLKKNGILVMAIPVTLETSLISFMKLGILSFTWSSEHYRLDKIKSEISRAGFEINEIQKIGKSVYEPLANYYIQNRAMIKEKILKEYPPYLESILYKSLLKMKDASQKEIIDYALIKCVVSKR
jgi:cyclopropane fatty-acyl-phospholipid synthase-like methyltransferase